MIISVFDIIENIVGKGENAGYQHFLLFPQCFEKASFPDTSKGVIVWEWIKRLVQANRFMFKSFSVTSIVWDSLSNLSVTLDKCDFFFSDKDS